MMNAKRSSMKVFRAWKEERWGGSRKIKHLRHALFIHSYICIYILCMCMYVLAADHYRPLTIAVVTLTMVMMMAGSRKMKEKWRHTGH
jgi:hypothetical protein